MREGLVFREKNCSLYTASVQGCCGHDLITCQSGCIWTLGTNLIQPRANCILHQSSVTVRAHFNSVVAIHDVVNKGAVEDERDLPSMSRGGACHVTALDDCRKGHGVVCLKCLAEYHLEELFSSSIRIFFHPFKYASSILILPLKLT